MFFSVSPDDLPLFLRSPQSATLKAPLNADITTDKILPINTRDGRCGLDRPQIAVLERIVEQVLSKERYGKTAAKRAPLASAAAGRLLAALLDSRYSIVAVFLDCCVVQAALQIR